LERLKKISQFQGPQLKTTTAPPKASSWKVVPIEGKGLGVVATKAIQAGACVISERPMMIARRGFIDQGYEQLSEEHKEIFDSLSASGPGNSVKERIFQCNAYRWRDAGALFPTIPRLNHSCTPNCNYATQLPSARGTFYALRALQAGEELTSAYTERVQPRLLRRRLLKESCRSFELFKRSRS
jgi:hypothetical protein